VIALELFYSLKALLFSTKCRLINSLLMLTNYNPPAF